MRCHKVYKLQIRYTASMCRSLLIFTLFLATSAVQAQTKKRVAVFNFEYGTVRSYVAGIFGSDVDIGKGIADLIVERLVTAGNFSVVERKAIDKIIAEQNLSNSDRADASSAAKLGAILGADAIIIGSITQFGRDDKTTNIGGLGNVGGRFGIGGIGKREAKAVVALSARLVNTSTSEVLAVANGIGESTRSGTALLGAGGTPAVNAGGNYDMSSKNFSNTILGEATGKAVMALAANIESNSARIPATVIKIDGLVADVSGNTLVLNIGAKAGLKVGHKLDVRRVSRTIHDPATGKVLRRLSEKVGEVTITEVDEASAVGTFSGAGAAKVGDSIGGGQ